MLRKKILKRIQRNLKPFGFTPEKREAFISINPYTNQHLHTIPYTSKEVINSTIQSLQASVNRKNRDIPSEFERMASILASKKRDLAELITMETGKCIKQAEAEVQKCIDHLVFWGGKSSQKNGDKGLYGKFNSFKRINLGLGGSNDAETGYWVDPLGIIYKIVPFNFPLWIALKSSIPILAAGNGVLLRMPNTTPLLGQALSEILKKSGIDTMTVIWSGEEEHTDFIMQHPSVIIILILRSKV